jgi:hypothetical protein
MLGFCVSHKFIVNKCNFGYMWVSYVGNFDPVKSLPTVWWCECAIDMPTYRLLCLRLLKTAVSIDPQCYTIISVSVYILASGQKLRSTSLEEDKQFFLRVSKKLIYLIYFPSFFLSFFFFFFCGTGAWIQGFVLAKQHSTTWTTTPVHIALVILESWSLVNCFSGLTSNCNPP